MIMESTTQNWQVASSTGYKWSIQVLGSQQPLDCFGETVAGKAPGLLMSVGGVIGAEHGQIRTTSGRTYFYLG